jgi:hypothetical protein
MDQLNRYTLCTVLVLWWCCVNEDSHLVTLEVSLLNLSIRNTVRVVQNENLDLNPVDCLRVTIEVIFERCVICTRVATVTTILLPQSHFQGAAGCYCTIKNNTLGIASAPVTQET